MPRDDGGRGSELTALRGAGGDGLRDAQHRGRRHTRLGEHQELRPSCEGHRVGRADCDRQPRISRRGNWKSGSGGFSSHRRTGDREPLQQQLGAASLLAVQKRTDQCERVGDAHDSERPDCDRTAVPDLLESPSRPVERKRSNSTSSGTTVESHTCRQRGLRVRQRTTTAVVIPGTRRNRIRITLLVVVPDVGPTLLLLAAQGLLRLLRLQAHHRRALVAREARPV